jgi:hypothetical protein
MLFLTTHDCNFPQNSITIDLFLDNFFHRFHVSGMLKCMVLLQSISTLKHKIQIENLIGFMVWFMVFNATFNNISVISRRSKVSNSTVLILRILSEGNFEFWGSVSYELIYINYN